MAAEFQKAGLEPAGTSGFMQPVSFKTRRIDEAHSTLSLTRDGRTAPLTLGEDANFSLRIDPAPSVDAPLVFVGHGLNIPEQQIDDLDGLNLTGAVVVYLATTPRSLPGALQAHFGSAAERWQALRAAGAVGTITIANPRNVETPWAQTTAARLLPAMSLADPALDEYPGQQISIAMNPAHANLLFKGRAARSTSCSRSRARASRCRASRSRRGCPRGSPSPGRRWNRRTSPASFAAPIRGDATSSSYSPRIWTTSASAHPVNGRRHLQRRDGQRVGHRRDPRSRRAAARLGRAAVRARCCSSR